MKKKRTRKTPMPKFDPAKEIEALRQEIAKLREIIERIEQRPVPRPVNPWPQPNNPWPMVPECPWQEPRRYPQYPWQQPPIMCQDRYVWKLSPADAGGEEAGR